MFWILTREAEKGEFFAYWPVPEILSKEPLRYFCSSNIKKKKKQPIIVLLSSKKNRKHILVFSCVWTEFILWKR